MHLTGYGVKEQKYYILQIRRMSCRTLLSVKYSYIHTSISSIHLTSSNSPLSFTVFIISCRNPTTFPWIKSTPRSWHFKRNRASSFWGSYQPSPDKPVENFKNRHLTGLSLYQNIRKCF